MTNNHHLLKEKRSHGNLMFPLMIHETQTDTQNTERLYCHWHEEFEILTVMKGQGTMQVDDKFFPLKKGDSILIPSNSLHSAKSTVGTGFDFCAIVFSRALLDSSLNDHIQQQYIDPLASGQLIAPICISPKEHWEQEIGTLIRQIKEAFSDQPPAYELFIKIKLYQIWYLLYLHAEKEQTPTEKYTDSRVSVVKSIIEYMESHYDNSISIPELANHFHMSDGHLCRFFKSLTRMSIIEYLNYYRISKSVELLESSQLDISAIALQVGFNNISYYNKVFRNYMNMTPTEYRKRMIPSSSPNC